ncbi:MAG: septum formation initiator family protein [Gemmatimonadaceae bacterium]
MAASPLAKRRLWFVLWLVGGFAAVWFAIQGGEYGTVDLIRQRGQRVRLDREIDSLARLVDSLARYKGKVLTDPATQERIAREEFGMIRQNELLYRITEPPDSTDPRTDTK